jgi:hypothetical protein
MQQPGLLPVKLPHRDRERLVKQLRGSIGAIGREHIFWYLSHFIA